MEALLDKFRINYSDLVIITDLSKSPSNSTKVWFDSLVQLPTDQRSFVRQEDSSSNSLALYLIDLTTRIVLM